MDKNSLTFPTPTQSTITTSMNVYDMTTPTPWQVKLLTSQDSNHCLQYNLLY